MKKYLAALVVPALLIITGAGCQNLYPPSAPTQTESTAPTAPAPTAPAAADEFNLKVEILNPGIVKLSWDAPKDLDAKTETFFLLHSAKPEPVYPGTFYYRRAGTDREATWGNIPSGQRYFRMCEAKGNECVKYSPVVAVDVK